MDTQLVVVENNIPVTTSYIMAEQLGIGHKSLMQLIKDHRARIEKHFGVLRFQNDKPLPNSIGGRPEHSCDLTENQTYYVLTLSRNTDKSMEVKALFVKAFDNAKQQLLAQQTQALVPAEQNKHTTRMIASLRHEIREIRQLLANPGENTHVSRQELEQRVFEAVSNAMPDYPDGICIREIREDDPWFAVYGQRYPSNTIFLYAERLVERGLLHREIRGRYSVHYYSLPDANSIA